MITDDLNAPTGEQPTMPGETIAKEMPTVIPDESIPEPEAEAEPPEEVEAEAGAEQGAETDEPAEKPEGDKKPEQKLDWREKRRIEETNKRRAAEAEVARLKAELAAKSGSTPPGGATPTATAEQTPEQIRAAAVEEAKRQLAAEQSQQAFAEATGRVLQAGLQAHPDFDQARVEMVQNFGDQLNQRGDFFEAIINLDNGHDVFYALAKDPEQAEQVLAMPPVKMAVKLAQLSASLGTKTPEAKPISKAPPPVKPVSGVPQSSSRLDDEAVPMDQWANTYLKQMKGKR